MYDAAAMATGRIIGAVILATGLVLAGFAHHHCTTAPLEDPSSTMTDRYSEGTMWYFIAVIAAAVGDGVLATFGGRK